MPTAIWASNRSAGLFLLCGRASGYRHRPPAARTTEFRPQLFAFELQQTDSTWVILRVGCGHVPSRRQRYKALPEDLSKRPQTARAAVLRPGRPEPRVDRRRRRAMCAGGAEGSRVRRSGKTRRAFPAGIWNERRRRLSRFDTNGGPDCRRKGAAHRAANSKGLARPHCARSPGAGCRPQTPPRSTHPRPSPGLRSTAPHPAGHSAVGQEGCRAQARAPGFAAGGSSDSSPRLGEAGLGGGGPPRSGVTEGAPAVPKKKPPALRPGVSY